MREQPAGKQLAASYQFRPSMSEPNEPRPNLEGPTGSAGPLIVQSGEIFQGRQEIWIEHGEEMYRLRITKSGKLHLTK